jgi:hypothetical protein
MRHIEKHLSMDSDELKLFSIVGKKECFRVPEGYFTQLPDKLASKLPEKRVVKGWRRLSLKVSFKHIRAAAFVAGAIGIATFLYLDRPIHSQSQGLKSRVSKQSTPSSVSSLNDHTLDEYADFAMLDNEDMYSYLEENEQ